MATTRRIAAAVGMAAVLVGAAGCSHVSRTPIPTTIPTAAKDRTCHLFSTESLRTISGGAEPDVRHDSFYSVPGTSRLMGAGCDLDAGDVYVKLTVDLQFTAADRDYVRKDLLEAIADEEGELDFAAAEGIGLVRADGDPHLETVSGALLRGQYEITIEMQGESTARDRLADARALMLQAVDALQLSSSDAE